MFNELCSIKNLELAYERAKKRKSLKDYVINFDENLEENLTKLRNELITRSYKPRPLKTFILRDPKTRKISKSEFRDRIVHHAMCNIIEQIFDKSFIYDNYANRLGKGSLKAIERFNDFKRKVSKNNTKICYILKADIKSYFDNVNHNIFLRLIGNKIEDQSVLNLIRIILDNHSIRRGGGGDGAFGMPLGNLTSQFFANIYLNELDQYVKHELKIKYYIRYVDDFVILDTSKTKLENYKDKINNFIKEKLLLELHPDKSKIIRLNNGVNFLGFRIFYHNKLIRKKNIRKFENKLERIKQLYDKELIERDKVIEIFLGWIAYVKNADTYKYRRQLTKLFNKCFPAEQQTEINSVQKHENIQKQIIISNYEFSNQKTLQLLRKGIKIKEIAEQRQIKESTVWEHLSKLIEYNQVSIWKIINKNKILKILPCVYSENDKLKDIKQRINDSSITYDEIKCVLSKIKYKNKKKNISQHFTWYRKIHCYRKCYYNKNQRNECLGKMNFITSKSQEIEMARKEFIELFNNHIKICILPENEKKSYISWAKFKKIRNL